ncbi:F-box protein At5g07610-like [Lolium rigidum]|uniref:F-box protein At5g07610-like n=1 Tax=Lolium rigidum TaxID=89674 RepID=UPI001F5D73AF|nr:F-box protein At5g07610-like [Lolium rigidum]
MAQSGSPPPFPTTEVSSEMRKKQKQEDEQEPLGSLPEGPLVEILSRVPYSSLCRFKCVSKPWLALCSDPQVRKRCPQTLSGFFQRYSCDKDGVQFSNLSGRGPPMVDPSLPFLRKNYEVVNLEHCCGGLVLCRCGKSGHTGNNGYIFVVCNPATGKWTQLPPCPTEFDLRFLFDLFVETEQYLGFDPAVPSRFVVFLNLWNKVAIYSSDTGRWTVVQSGWIYGPRTMGYLECVFLNGTMHLLTSQPSILTVDTKGEVWGEIDIPGNVPQSCVDHSIGQSQGCLYAWYVDNPNTCQLSVWALQEYGSENWTLKHTVNILELFGTHHRKADESYKMFAIHPDRNLIFLTDGKKKTISYDMDNQEVHVIGICKKLWGVQPYIPCFAEWPSVAH